MGANILHSHSPEGEPGLPPGSVPVMTSAQQAEALEKLVDGSGTAGLRRRGRAHFWPTVISVGVLTFGSLGVGVGIHEAQKQPKASLNPPGIGISEGTPATDWRRTPAVPLIVVSPTQPVSTETPVATATATVTVIPSFTPKPKDIFAALLDALPPENPYTPANCPTVPHSKSFDALKTFQNYFDGLRSDLKSNNSKNVQEDWDALLSDVGCNQDWKTPLKVVDPTNSTL